MFGGVQALGLWTAFRFLRDTKLNYLVPDVSADLHLNLLDIFVLAAFTLIFIFLAKKMKIKTKAAKTKKSAKFK